MLSASYEDDKIALRTRRYKYVHDLGEDSAGRDELYDWHAVPGELHNLATERPEMVDRFRRRMDVLWTTYASEGLDPPARDAGELDLEILRTLGYAD